MSELPAVTTYNGVTCTGITIDVGLLPNQTTVGECAPSTTQ
jgi:hypothetical protein